MPKSMRELRPLPPHPGQTDLFGDPAFVGAGGPVAAAVGKVALGDSQNKPVTGHQPNCPEMGAKIEACTEAGIKTSRPKNRVRHRAEKQVTGHARRSISRRSELSAGAKQAQCRDSKRKKGLRLLEIWVPISVKRQCRAAARRGKTSMGRVASGLLAAALGVATAGPARGSP